VIRSGEMKKWKLLDKEKVFETPWFSIEKRKYRLPEGQEKGDYYHLNRPDYVLGLVEDGRGNILIEKQYRRAVNDFVYEIPAGWIDKGESPEQAMEREMEEETGLRAKVYKKFAIYPLSGFTSMKAYACLMKLEGDGEMKRDEDEQIESEWVSLSRLKEMVKSGKIRDMGFLATLSLFNLL
jgi:8-oxo-dGTP pyrophosphatase MutT (NUDIX family)